MRGITNYKPSGHEKKLFQTTDKLARKIKVDMKKFSRGRK